MVVVSILPQAELGPNDHRKHAPDFTFLNWPDFCDVLTLKVLLWDVLKIFLNLVWLMKWPFSFVNFGLIHDWPGRKLQMITMKLPNTSELTTSTMLLLIWSTCSGNRIRISSTKSVSYSLIAGSRDSLWFLFFILDSRRHNIMTKNVFLEIHRNGYILLSERLSLKLKCPMLLKYYPFDLQICPIRIESYAFRDSQVKFSLTCLNFRHFWF